MSTLHIVNKTGQPLTLCLRSLGKSDAVLFFEDGVYNLAAASAALFNLNQPVFALTKDCQARGLPTDIEKVEHIATEDFVILTEQYSKVLSWF